MSSARILAPTLTMAAAAALAVAGAAAAHPSGDGGGLTDLDRRVMAAGAPPVPPATPRAQCLPGSDPEPGIQGRVPAGAPGAADGFSCNMTLISHHGRSGGFKVHRFVDRAGNECAYYDTTLLFPSNVQHLSEQPTGVAVLDMSDPANPVRTDTLSTPAMQTPHESLVMSRERGLLVAVMGTATFQPGFVDVYDLNDDCRHPKLQSSLPVGLLGHESGMAPDGRTFYATSLFTGNVTAVDLTNPQLPVPLWEGIYRSHGLTVGAGGDRAYLADLNDGLVILDTSEVQSREANPQVREVSRLNWPLKSIPQVAIPVTIDGRPYIVEVDEFATEPGEVIPVSNGPTVGAARIIDVSDETAPEVVSDIRLGVNQPENRDGLAGDPGASSPAQGYAGHYCEVPQREEPGIVACSFIASGLRVFDIRDPRRPREIAYFTTPLTHSSNGGTPSNYAMSAPAFVPERREIWYADGNTGFYALRVAKGVWPFERGGVRRPGCLARRSPVGPRNIGRVRLGYTRARTLRRVRPQPEVRGQFAFRWCVKRSRGSVTAVFSRPVPRGRVRLVLSTARRHALRTVRRGARVGRLVRRFPHARRLGRGLYRAGPRSRRLFGTRGGRVRFVAVSDAKLLRKPRRLRAYLRRGDIRP
jgi:hypothetical protein